MEIPASAYGRFKLSLNGTYMIEWKWQPDGINWESAVGKYVIGPLPRWRHALSLDWDAGPWGATLSQTFQSGYEDFNFFPPRLTPPPEPRRVSSYDVWDLQARYTGIRNASIALGIRNLWDRDPPASNQPGTAQVGYDPSYADPRGRTYYARLVYAFK
jgi:iron complex outermembrane receptor protein